MTLTKLNTREQILIGLVMVSIFLGGYTLFRFIPKNSEIASLQKQVAKTERKLNSARIPDEPNEGVEELLIKLDEQEQSLSLLKDIADGVAQRLAPFDSQQVIILVSQLARQSGVRVKTSEALKTPITATAMNKKQRERLKKARSSGTKLILPASRSWIDRMSLATMFHRPMQRLVLEGDYQSIRAFIHGLDNLEWQVTVVRFNIEKMPTVPLRGYAQVLKSELVLAL